MIKLLPRFLINNQKLIQNLLKSILFKDALDCGISVNEFYDMTIKELTEYRDSFLRRREIKRKDSADMVYRLAILITNGTACILSEKSKPIEFLDMFGDIFEKESKINEENKKKSSKWKFTNKRMREFAERVNKQMNGGEG